MGFVYAFCAVSFAEKEMYTRMPIHSIFRNIALAVRIAVYRRCDKIAFAKFHPNRTARPTPCAVVKAFKYFCVLDIDWLDVGVIVTAVAIKYFKKCYPGYKTVAVGDSFNDIGMFETCDISIAMGNSVDAIKKMTTYVTKSIDDDGVQYALNHILKI